MWLMDISFVTPYLGNDYIALKITILWHNPGLMYFVQDTHSRRLRVEDNTFPRYVIHAILLCKICARDTVSKMCARFYQFAQHARFAPDFVNFVNMQ